jgi:hypothetical protein
MNWSYDLGAKGGQKVKEKDNGEDVVTSTSPDFGLKITLKDRDVQTVIYKIMKKVGGVSSCTLNIDGSEEELKRHLKDIVDIIADETGQEKLDLHFEVVNAS